MHNSTLNKKGDSLPLRPPHFNHYVYGCETHIRMTFARYLFRAVFFFDFVRTSCGIVWTLARRTVSILHDDVFFFRFRAARRRMYIGFNVMCCGFKTFRAQKWNQSVLREKNSFSTYSSCFLFDFCLSYFRHGFFGQIVMNTPALQNFF